MLLRLVLSWAVLLLCMGCRKGESPPEAASAASTASLEGVLSELTQALRKYSAEKRQVPESLTELVAAGYLKTLPQPPTGKEFGIDPKNLSVIVR